MSEAMDTEIDDMKDICTILNKYDPAIRTRIIYWIMQKYKPYKKIVIPQIPVLKAKSIQ